MTIKKILVTGGNKGIGYGTCLTLLRDHPTVHVLLGARDATRGEAAVQQLHTEVETAAGRVEWLLLDASSVESVHAAASQVEAGSLYGVVNNAGVGAGLSQTTTLATNYWGVRHVTEAFLPKLQSSQGRIVNVSSAAGPMFVSGLPDTDPLKAKLTHPWTIASVAELDEIASSHQVSDQGPKSWDSYGFSKALVNCYTYLVSRQHPDLVVNALTPGFIKTDLTKGNSGATKTPLDGAVPIVYCLFDDEVAQQPQGRFYGSDCVRSPLHLYRNPGDPPYDGPDGP